MRAEPRDNGILGQAFLLCPLFKKAEAHVTRSGVHRPMPLGAVLVAGERRAHIPFPAAQDMFLSRLLRKEPA